MNSKENKTNRKIRHADDMQIKGIVLAFFLTKIIYVVQLIPSLTCQQMINQLVNNSVEKNTLNLNFLHSAEISNNLVLLSRFLLDIELFFF